ncbi:MAG TPA: hypothetical protein VGC21_05765 [Telluria sp.]|jgi:hypothetical protein
MIPTLRVCNTMAALAAAGATGGCGASMQATKQSVPLSLMKITTPVYRFDSAGRLFNVDLNQHRSTLVSDHQFREGGANVVLSADGQWLVYSGIAGQPGTTQYWLYDRHSETDRLVFEHQAWGGGITAFSPDGRFLAIAANYHHRWASTAGAGLYLFDTLTSKLLTVSLPATIPLKQAWMSTSWSQDGGELLIMRRSMSGTDKWEYFSYRPISGTLERLSGHYDSTSHQHVFVRESKPIPASEPVPLRSAMGLRDASSPDGQWRAYLGKAKPDSRYPLVLLGKDSARRHIALGHHDHCMGDSVFITGWLDARHLVYRYVTLRYFVFDVETGNTAELFGETDGPKSFSW